MSLWRYDDFAAALGGRLIGWPPEHITGISIDSRTVKPGEAFFAIRGDRFDGHHYVAAALKAGAAIAVAGEGRIADPAEGAVTYLPDDPLDGLVRLATASRARMAGRVIGVTGSVGKTGTKEMLAAALAPIGATHAPVGSFNNHWGVPLTLARMPEATRFGIFEMGMNHAGEIRPLTAMVRPHVAIVTIVGGAHAENFDSEAGIAEAKAEIFEGLEPGGIAVLNRDNEWFGLLAERAAARGARIVGFGEHAEAEVRIVGCVLGPDGSDVELSLGGERFAFRLGAPGRHLVQNAAAVVAAARAAGVAPADLAPGLAAFRAPKGRGERIRLVLDGSGEAILIDESYNANPVSMRAALALLGQTRPAGQGRRIAVLGDMLELGAEAGTLHRGLREPIEASGADCVFLAGPAMESLWRDLPDRLRGAYCGTSDELAAILPGEIGPGDVVMIKASLGTRFGPIVDELKRRFVPGGS